MRRRNVNSGVQDSAGTTGREGNAKSFSKWVGQYREKEYARRDAEFRAAALEVLDSPPAPLSRITLMFVVMFSVFVICWAVFAKMDIVITATGVVIPKGKVKVVQPHGPGIITAIHVLDGQLVKKGDPLISMDNSENLSDIRGVKKELLIAGLNIKRINAELQGDEGVFDPPVEADEQTVLLQRRLLQNSITAHRERLATLETEIERCFAERDSIRSNVDRLAASHPLSRQLFERKKVLAGKKLISSAEILKAQIDMNDALHNLHTAQKKLQESEVRLERAKEEKQLAQVEYRRDLLHQLTQAENSSEQLLLHLAKVLNRQGHFELKAPADGIVQQLAVNTIGGVVTAAQPLLVIVPTNCGLEVEAKVLNKDIGFIDKKQGVSVKVAAYPFTRYGDIEGTIEWVARDAVIDDELGPSYPIRVSVVSYTLPNIVHGRQGVIAPGMTVTADVKVGQRRVIEYFLGPVLRYKDESLREI